MNGQASSALMNMGNIFYNRILKKRPLLLTVITTFIMAVLLYRDFILSGTPLFMAEFDGWGQFWPILAAQADYIRANGLPPQWHFGIGLGSAHVMGLSPFIVIPVLLGRDVIPHVFVWMHISRIIVASLFFYLYLSKFNFRPYVCSLFSILFAFSGHMIVRGGNFFVYGIEAATIAFLLYALEVYIQDKKWKLLPIAVFFVGASLTAQHLFMYTILVFVYVTTRYLYTNSFRLREYLLFITKGGSIYSIGAFMSMLVFVPMIVAMLLSARGEGIVYEMELLSLVDHDNNRLFLSAFFRTFSNSILGTGIHAIEGFGGAYSALHGPLHYAGIILVFLIPFFFYYADKKARKYGAIGLSAVVLYYLSPIIRLTMNAFISYHHYKLSSFWITILLLFIAAYTTNRIIESNKMPQNLIVISWLSITILFVGFVHMAADYNLRVNNHAVFAVVIFLAVYALLFYTLGTDVKRKTAMMLLLFAFCISEVYSFSRVMTYSYYTNRVPAMTRHFGMAIPEFLQRNPIFGKIEQKNEGAEFYRINTGPGFGSDFGWRYPWSDNVHLPVDAGNRIFPEPVTRQLLDGYFGSSHFDGLVSPAHINFMRGVGLKNVHASGASSSGLGDRPILQTLTAHKYTVVRSDWEVPIPFGYTYHFTEGDRRVYINNYYLPIGFAYDSFITREQFDALHSLVVRDIAMLSSVVLEQPSSAIDNFNFEELYVLQQYIGFSDIAEMEYRQFTSIQNNLPEFFSATSYGTDPGVVIPIHSENGYKHYTITVTITSDFDTSAQIYWASEDEMFTEDKSYSQHLRGGERATLTVTVDNANLSGIRIDPGMRTGDYVIENLVVTAIDVPLSNYSYSQAVMERRTEIFELDYFSHRHITGTIETFGNRVLFFSIPHANGWRMYVNGERVPIETVNIGFIGTIVGEGTHDIELRFRLPGLIAGIIMSAIGAVAYAILFVIDKSGKLKL